MSDADAAWAHQQELERRYFEEQEALRADPAWEFWLAYVEARASSEAEERK
jgi:hypothetical protein